MAQVVGDKDLRRMLNEVVTASEELLPALLRLAKRVEDGRQSRLLRDDLARLRGRAELLSETEREQLSSLERLDELSRVSGALIDDTQAILGRCYAQSRGLTLARGLAEGEAQLLIRQLREQSALLGHVTEALREVGAR